MDQKKVIVRGNRSGVFYGKLVEKEGQNVKLANARKLFYWEGACAVEQIALDGVVKPDRCKFTVFVENMEICDAIQILDCTEKACKCIEEVSIWKR